MKSPSLNFKFNEYTGFFIEVIANECFTRPLVIDMKLEDDNLRLSEAFIQSYNLVDWDGTFPIEDGEMGVRIQGEFTRFDHLGGVLGKAMEILL